jgi:putative ABC transport system permease protein
MTSILQDIRFALRQLRRSPGFALTAILTLALGIGATTAMVSMLRATLLNPTPYPGAAELVGISDVNLKGVPSNGLVTVARAGDLAQTPANGKPVFASLAFFYFDQPALKIGGQPPVSTSAVGASGDFFRVLGAAPLLGRVFTSADDAQGAPETAVISCGLWQRVFAADPSIKGRSVVLAGKPTTILGVMPRLFDYPLGIEVWKPAHLSPQQFNGYRGESTRFVNVVARLSSGITLSQSQTAADLLAARLGHSYAGTDAEWGFHVTSLRSEIFGSYREALLLLSAAVGILLLIACSNVAGLQLSRNAARQQEMALRRALGISTARLVRQLLTESLLLLATGAGLGVSLAMGLLRVLATRLPATLVSIETPHIDRVTLFVTITVSFTLGSLCALAPAMQFGRAPVAVFAGQSRAVAGSTRRFGRRFATIQIGLALVLLALAASLLQNLYRLLQTPLGYDPSHVVTAAVHLPFGSDPVQTHRFYQQFEQRIGALPGVSSVGAIVALPLSNFSSRFKADIDGRPLTLHHDTVNAGVRTMTPGYVGTMQIPLLAGRDFNEHDGDLKAPEVALVNRSFAAEYFPSESATGKRLVVVAAADQRLAPVEIVGVIGDVHGEGGDLAAPVGPEIYQPEQGYGAFMTYVVRTTLPAGALEPALRQKLAALDPGVALGEVADYTGLLDHALAQPRLNAGLLSGLAGLALVLVLIGVYGVIAFSVAQRTREIAVRLALGSSKGAIFALLLQESAAMLAAGIACGVFGAAAAERLLTASLGTPAAHLPTGASTTSVLLLTSVFLTCAVAAASLLPARRAASIDPMQALRSE